MSQLIANPMVTWDLIPFSFRIGEVPKGLTVLDVFLSGAYSSGGFESDDASADLADDVAVDASSQLTLW